MSWTQQDGYWSGPLDCHEKLFRFIGDVGKPLGRPLAAAVRALLELKRPVASQRLLQ
jgi:hypothetical protein